MKYVYKMMVTLCMAGFLLCSCSEYLASVIWEGDAQKAVDDGLHFSPDGGEVTLPLRQNTDFSVHVFTKNGGKWLRVNGQEDSATFVLGNPEQFEVGMDLSVSASENTGLQARQGTVVLEAPHYRKEISVEQDSRKILSLASSSVYNLPSMGDTIVVKLRANINYNTSYDVSATWFHLLDSVRTDSMISYRYKVDALPDNSSNVRFQLIHFNSVDDQFTGSSPQVLVKQFPAEKRVDVSKPGTLSSLFQKGELESIKKLVVTGTLNGDDVLFLRTLYGATTSYGSVDAPYIESLDLSQAHIVKGGASYADYWRLGTSGQTEHVLCYTKDNVLTEQFFMSCERLRHLKLPESIVSIESIGDAAIEELTIPDGVREMKRGVFQCPQLKQLAFGSSLTVLPYYAFVNCPQLSKVIIPASVTSFIDSQLLGANCASEGELHVKAKFPPRLDGALDYMYRWKLYVPDGSASVYRQTAGWSGFKEIIEE